MRVFYSWQSDAPRRTNKDFIRSAIDAAVTELVAEIEVTSADRDAGEPIIEVDQDTQGVLGSPPIAQIIFEKIASADVILFDVSLVAIGGAQKKHINSNVAIELGFALGRRSYTQLIKVMNTAFGAPELLPFDLRDRRYPVRYELRDSATDDDVDKARTRLAKDLKQIFALYLKQAPATAEKQTHQPIESIGQYSNFWPTGRTIVEPDDSYGRPALKGDASPRAFIRYIPHAPMSELSSLECLKWSRELVPLVSINGWSHERNEWGAICYDWEKDPAKIIGAFQVFKNRELWGFENGLLTYRHEQGQAEGFLVVSPVALRNDLSRGIQATIPTARRLYGGNAFKVVLGLSGLEGHRVVRSNRVWVSAPQKIYEREIVLEMDASDGLNAETLLDGLIKKVSEAAGYE